MKLVIQMQCLIPFSFRQLCNRNACPAGYDLCDFFLIDIFMHKRKILWFYLFLFYFKLLLQIWQFAIGKLCGFLQIAFPLCDLDLVVDRLDLLTHFLQPLYGILFVFPGCFLAVKFLFQFCQFLLQVGKSFFGKTVIFLLQRSFLNLHLHHFTAHFIQLGRHGIQLCLDQGTCLINKVDRFIRQKSVRNITVR